MFSTVTESGGTIYEKTLPLSQADTDGANFPAGLGTARITDADQLKMNNATSTKQSVSLATGLVVLASNRKTNVTPKIEDYWHHYDSLGAGDSVPPVLQTASITGSTITVAYNEALDSSSVPAAAAFAVTVGGAARPVSTVIVSGAAVTLRLPAPVIAGNAVVLSYTAPATGPVQDVAGNDAAGLVNQTLTNSTPAALAYDLVPTGDGARSAITTNSGGTTNLFAAVDESLALSDNDATYVHNNATSAGGQDGFAFFQLTDTPSNFTAMTGVTIDLRARTIARTDDNTTLFAQLFKADEVTPLSAEAQVTLNPGTANWVTISNVALTGIVPGTKADWDGARVKLRWDATVVNTPDNGNRVRVTTLELDATHGSGPVDTIPPVFQSGAVNGATLTMTYNETLDTASVPATTAFAVTVNGAARGVSTVAVSGTTLTLTLSSAVTAGQTVTVAYTKPGTSPLQDVAGNDAVNLAATNVTNSTAGSTALDMKPNGDGSNSGLIVSGAGLTSNLFAQIDEGIAAPDDAASYIRNYPGLSASYFAQLTDTQTGFTGMSSLKVDIRARTTSRVDDSAALYAQVFKADQSTPLSAEVLIGTNPGLTGWATITGVSFTGLVSGTKSDWDGAKLRLRWAIAVVGSSDSAMQLQVSTAELHGTSTGGGGGGGGGDVTAPVLQTATVNGPTLTLTYNEPLDAASKPAPSVFVVRVNGLTRSVSAVGIAGSAVTLSLTSPVVSTNGVTVSYAKPATNPTQDVAGNDAASFTNQSVTNSTPGGGGGGGTVTLSASADAWVNSSAPTTNYGSATSLQISYNFSSGTARTYLKFDLSTLTGAVKSAKLRFYVTDPGASGATVSATSAGWSEGAITWSTAPAVGSFLASAPTGTTSYVDVAIPVSAISGSTVAFVLTQWSTDLISLASRETSNSPQLVITTG